MRRFITIMLALAASLAADGALAQRMPERGFVRRGNRQFDRMNFDRAVDLYGRAVAADSTSFEARYDYGNALYRAGRPDAAAQALAVAAADTTRTDAERAEAFFNLGDIQLGGQNLQGALECFKNSLRLNPSDMEAKYNYAYVKKLLEQQQQNDQNDDDKNNDNKDNKDNKDKGGQNGNDGDDDRDEGDDGNGDQQSGDGDEDPRDGDGKPRQGGISPEQAEAMLDAIQAQEDKTQDKVNEKKAVVIRNRKNW